MDNNLKKQIQKELAATETVDQLIAILTKHFDRYKILTAYKKWQLQSFGITFLEGLPEKTTAPASMPGVVYKG